MGGEKVPPLNGAFIDHGSPPHGRGKDQKDPIEAAFLSAGRSRFIQFCIDLLDQAAVGQGAMGLLLGNLKMPGQR